MTNDDESICCGDRDDLVSRRGELSCLRNHDDFHSAVLQTTVLDLFRQTLCLYERSKKKTKSYIPFQIARIGTLHIGNS